MGLSLSLFLFLVLLGVAFPVVSHLLLAGLVDCVAVKLVAAVVVLAGGLAALAVGALRVTADAGPPAHTLVRRAVGHHRDLLMLMLGLVWLVAAAAAAALVVVALALLDDLHGTTITTHFGPFVVTKAKKTITHTHTHNTWFELNFNTQHKGDHSKAAQRSMIRRGE